jgi:hypothetical protein
VNPRITLLVLAYQQAAHIEGAVRSALAQACEPIEIILSDDASVDGSFEKMQALGQQYAGPHRIRLNRNETNLGIGQHYNRLITQACGELIVTQAGDDISLPQRVARIAAAWDADGQRRDLIASHLIDMAYDGTEQGLMRADMLQNWRSLQAWQARRPFVVGAAHAFTKRLHQRFGPYVAGLTYEDQANVFRALGSGGATTVDEALVKYRRGGVSAGLQTFGAAEFKFWSMRRNQAHLALHQQWLQDAQTLGLLAEIEAATSTDHAREQCMQALLAAPSTQALWREAMKRTAVPLAWRLRKALHLTWPGLAARRHQLKV